MKSELRANTTKLEHPVKTDLDQSPELYEVIYWDNWVASLKEHLVNTASWPEQGIQFVFHDKQRY